MSGWVCALCGSGNRPEQSQCWICAAARPQAPALLSPPAAAPAQDAAAPFLAPGVELGYGLRLTTWLLLILAILFLATMAGFELGANWPGLLIPYALVVLVGGAGLGATMVVHLRAVRKARSQGLVKALDVMLGATAGAITGILVVLVLLFLLVMVIIVLLFLVCMGILGVASMQ